MAERMAASEGEAPAMRSRTAAEIADASSDDIAQWRMAKTPQGNLDFNRDELAIAERIRKDPVAIASMRLAANKAASDAFAKLKEASDFKASGNEEAYMAKLKDLAKDSLKQQTLNEIADHAEGKRDISISPAMRIKDMDDEQLQNYLRPLVMAAGDDPVKKEAAYKLMMDQMHAEEQAELQANLPPELEVSVGPEDPPSPMKEAIHGALEQYVRSPVETKQLTKPSTAEGPVTPEYILPTLKGFKKMLKGMGINVTEDSIRWIYMDKLDAHLLNASGKRLEDFRKGLKLEGARRYGRREVADPERPMTQEEKADFARSTMHMTEREYKKYEKDIEKSKQQQQDYRNRLITEIRVRMARQAMPKTFDIARQGLSLEDIAFDNDSTRLGAYRSFSSGESRNVGWLQNWLDDEARESRTGNRTRTKRLTVLVNRKTGTVDVVSTYKHPNTKRIMLYDPITMPLEWERKPAIPGEPGYGKEEGKGILKKREMGARDKAHHNLESLIKQFRVKASILLTDPVQNFHMRFEADPETGRSAEQVFMDAIGTEGEGRTSGNDEIWGDMNREAAESRAALKASAQQAQLGEPSEMQETGRGHLTTMGEATEPPETAVEESEGGSFTGPHADIARAQAGVLRSNLKYFARGPMTTAEARGVYWLFDGMEISSPMDIKYALQVLHELSKQIEITGRRRGLRGNEYAAMVGIDKAVKKHYFELLNDQESVESAEIREDLKELQRPINEHLDQLDKIKDPEARKVMTGAIRRLRDRKHAYLEGIKMEAMFNALNELYEHYDKAKNEQAVKIGEDPILESFKTKALDRYGDHTGRALESAALPEVAPAESGARSLIEGLGKRQPREPAGRVLAYGGPEKLPVHLPEGMLTPEAQARLAAEAKVSYPYIPTAPGYQKPLLTPKGMEGEIAPVGKRPQGFVPGEQALSKKAGPAMRTRGEEEGPAMRSSIYGISQSAREDRAAKGLVFPVEPGKGALPEELIEKGREMHKQDPTLADKILTNFEADPNKRLNDMDIAITRAKGEELQRDCDIINDTKGHGTEAFRKAFRELSLWDERTKPLQTMWARMGNAQQGTTDVYTGSFTSMHRDFRDATGEDFDEGQEKTAKKYERETRKAEEAFKKSKDDLSAKINKPEPLDPQVASLADKIIGELRTTGMSALEKFKARQAARAAATGPSMTMRTEGPAMKTRGLDPEDVALAVEYGAFKMAEMSKDQALKMSAWQKQMIADMGEEIRPHLPDIWEEAQKRVEKQAASLGPEPAYEPVKQLLTRQSAPETQATREGVIQAMKEIGNRTPTPKQARAIWNYVKKMYLDKGETDFVTIRSKVANDLGMSNEQVTRALAANKTLHRMTNEMWLRAAQHRQIVNEARNWLLNQERTWFHRTARVIPRVFFIDKIFGHGTVGLITHAGNMVFNPNSWKVYFPEWIRMYKMVRPTKGGLAYHEQEMRRLVQDRTEKGDENFYTVARRAGLQNNPFKLTDDYQVMALTKFFRHMIGNRGFDALKTLRQARFNQLWLGTPESIRNDPVAGPRMAKLWADSINHATGIIRGSSPEWTNWMFFAPKLEASRWAYAFGDTYKQLKIAGDVLSGRRKSTPEERFWAAHELRDKAAMFAMYASLLAMNQGILSAIGSEQKINGIPKSLGGAGINPRRGDFLSFKVAGYNVGVVGPMIGMIKLFYNLAQDIAAKRKPVEQLTSRYEKMGGDLAKYARGKFSPFFQNIINPLVKADIYNRPLPWSQERPPAYLRRKGIGKFTMNEYLATQFVPIPAEEVVREVFRNQGMGKEDQDRWLRALGIGVIMGGTGIRVTEDLYR